MRANESLTVGIPRALLYYRYGSLWQTFFDELGVQTVESSPTSRKILENGRALAADEACLSLKLFLGHVNELIGSCDYILIPRISSFGRNRNMCVRFEALYDLTRNVFRETDQKFLTYDVNAMNGEDEAAAMLHMGQSLGFPKKAVKKAYAMAEKADRRRWRDRIRAEEQLYKAEGLKILVAAHSYIAEDPYIGKPVMDSLRKLGAIPIRADVVDREAARKHSAELSPTCKWEVNREIIGGIALHQKKIDGIILLSAFPCGPDAMVNELMARRLSGVPLLTLVLDEQSGAAGIETRIESFVDIIRFKKGAL